MIATYDEFMKAVYHKADAVTDVKVIDDEGAATIAHFSPQFEGQDVVTSIKWRKDDDSDSQ